MTKAQLEDKYWHEFLKWCATTPERTADIIYWLDHNQPTENNFWEWVAKFRGDIL